MKKTFLILFLIITFSFSTPQISQALCYKMASYVQDGRPAQQTPLFNLQIFNGGGEGCFPIATQEQTGFTSYNNGIQFLFDLMIGVSIALAVILFTYGAAQGIFYSVSSDELTAGRKTMKNALIGLLIILGMWLVVNTINPDLLRLPALQGLYQLNSAGKAGNPEGGATARPAG
jgi:hypothetical protein